MLRAAIVVSGIVLAFSACGGDGASPTRTAPSTTASASTTAAVTLDELRPFVPEQWAIEDWRASTDGRYLVLSTVSSAAVPATGPAPPAVRIVSIIQRDAGRLTEIARWAAGAGLHLPPGPLLDADPGGIRSLALSAAATSGIATVNLRVAIDAAGTVSVRSDSDKPSTPVAATGTAVSDPLSLVEATRPSSYASATPSPSFDVPAGSVLAGWHALSAAWSPDRRYVAVITSHDGSPFAMQELDLYDTSGGALREMRRFYNYFVSLDDALAFKDLNGDGLPDLVYAQSNGGNGWTWGGDAMLSIHPDGTTTDVVFKLPIPKSAPSRPVDINGDGVYEWLAVDASWELTEFCHACSPSSAFVLAWDGSAYVDATPRFADYVIGQRADPAPPAAGSSCRDVDSYLSQLVGRYLDYFNAGRPADAARIRQQLMTYEPIGALAAKRDRIAAELVPDPNFPSPTAPGPFGNDCP